MQGRKGFRGIVFLGLLAAAGSFAAERASKSTVSVTTRAEKAGFEVDALADGPVLVHIHEFGGGNVDLSWDRPAPGDEATLEAFGQCLQDQRWKESFIDPSRSGPNRYRRLVDDCADSAGLTNRRETSRPEALRYELFISTADSRESLEPPHGTSRFMESGGPFLGARRTIAKPESAPAAIVPVDAADCLTKAKEKGVFESSTGSAITAGVTGMAYSTTSIGPLVARIEQCLTGKGYLLVPSGRGT